MAHQGALKGRKLLVTGATGYLGSWMAELAHRAGCEVRLLVRRVPEHFTEWAAKFDVVEADLLTSHTLTSACRGCDLVWHTASLNETRAEGDVAAAIATNVTGTSRLLEGAVAAAVPIVVKFSTFHVYGHRGSEPVTELTVPRPRSIYGLTNLLGDEAAQFFHRRHGIGIRIARISNGYGAPLSAGVDRWTLVVNDLTRSAFEKKQIVLHGSGLQHRDFVSIPDVFDAVSRLSAPDVEPEIVHVGGGSSRSILDVARLTQQVYAQRYGVEIPIRTPAVTSREIEAPVIYDIARLRSFGFAPTDIMADEIGRTLAVLESSKNL